jgi:hypothetical protein
MGHMCCWLRGHSWFQAEVIEASWDAYHDVWICTQCGQRNAGRITMADLTAEAAAWKRSE